MSKPAVAEKDSVMRVDKKDGAVSVVLSGHLAAESVGKIWGKTMATLKDDTKATVDASGIEYCDGAGVALLWELKKSGAEIKGLKPEYEKMLEPFAQAEEPDEKKDEKVSHIEGIGRVTAEFFQDIYEQVVFLGQVSVIAVDFFRKPGWLRWGDVWLTFQRAGVQALTIVFMISFLTGLIMAFQSATPLKQFGVDIFVVNLVALAMLRELGPIMTAIVLAGRSGSAFAAEIGTMKVNEEINALNTMGIDPVRFLVAPRMLAGIMVTPLLTIYADLAGVMGGFLVMLGTGYPFAALWRQLLGAVEMNDIFAGLIKGFVFGALVASVGCLRGLQTKSGASAVGVSTTRSVVTSIFLIVVVDAIFAVIYYAIDF